MKIKKTLLKASATVSYVFAFLYALLAAYNFSLSNNIYWLFAILIFASIVMGILTWSIAEKYQQNQINQKDKTKQLIYTIVSIVALPSFVLSLIALLITDDLIEDPIMEVLKEEAEEKPKKTLTRKHYVILTSVAIGICLISSFFAMVFSTSGFKVKISSFTLTKEMTEKYNNDPVLGKKHVIADGMLKYAVDLYVPKGASTTNQAPVVFVMPGFTRTKETQAQYCIELSRRGFVVFCIDPGSQGGTTAAGYQVDENGEYILDENGERTQIGATTAANGLNYLIHYVYNNTEKYNYIDRERFGVTGHSAGGGNAITAAKEFAGANYEDSVIKAVYCSGYIKVSAANNYKSLRANAAMSYAYFDEGAFRYQTPPTTFETIALRFINEVNGGDLGHKEAIYNYEYGNIDNGTYRVVYNENINHCFEVYSKSSVSNTVDFFTKTLNVETKLATTNHIWWGKEFFNGFALIGAFMLVMSLSGLLITTKFFSSVKGLAPERIKKQTTSDKIIFWCSLVVTAIIACLDYMPLAAASMRLFPDAASNTYTFYFPARMFNAVMLWAVVNGTIGLVVFFGTNLLKNLYEKIIAKKQGREPKYDFEQFKSLRINWKDLLKTFLLSVILFFGFYFMVQMSYWVFHQDFRFMMISTGTLSPRFLVTWLMYIPLFFIFYIANSISVNCGMTFENWKEWKIMLVSGLANSLALVFIIIVNYVVFIKTGTVYYGYYGPQKSEVWLYINMVFPLIVMMFLLPIFNRIFYKQTNKVYLGAFTNVMIFIMMSLCATVAYIPL